MKQPLVTISIPTYNSDKFIAQCLKAISEQTYQHIEINIVDGGSKDETIAIAKQSGGQRRPCQSCGRLQTMKNEGLTILDHSNSCLHVTH